MTLEFSYLVEKDATKKNPTEQNVPIQDQLLQTCPSVL